VVSTVQYSTVHLSTVVVSTVQYSTVQYSTVHCAVVLCHDQGTPFPFFPPCPFWPQVSFALPVRERYLQQKGGGSGGAAGAAPPATSVTPVNVLSRSGGLEIDVSALKDRLGTVRVDIALTSSSLSSLLSSGSEGLEKWGCLLFMSLYRTVVVSDHTVVTTVNVTLCVPLSLSCCHYSSV